MTVHGKIHLRLRDHFDTEEEYMRWLITVLRERADYGGFIMPDTAAVMIAAADQLDKVVFR